MQAAAGMHLAFLRRDWWKVLLLSLAVGVAVFAWMRRMPNVYVASAVVAPPPDESRQSPGLGALASLGVIPGGSSRVEDLETLFRSGNLAVRVFAKHDLWPAVLGDRYDPKTGKVKISRFGRWLDPDAKEGAPTDWDAIRAAGAALRVGVNKKASTVTVSFESTVPEGSADAVRFFLEEGKGRLQEEALGRATKNKQFIREQIAATIDPLTRDRLYAMYGQEVEREMMARNRDQYGFRVIDDVRVPDIKSGPKRVKSAMLATVVGSLFWTILFGIWDCGSRRR